jgi:hypothetical protein
MPLPRRATGTNRPGIAYLHRSALPERSPPISRLNLTRANRQSRSTVARELAAVSSTLGPPKNRNSITFALRGSNSVSAVRASSIAISSGSAPGGDIRNLVRIDPLGPHPPRLRLRFARDPSTRMRRIILAATASALRRAGSCQIGAALPFPRESYRRILRIAAARPPALLKRLQLDLHTGAWADFHFLRALLRQP